MDADDFIRISKSVHGEKYCYDRVDYKGPNEKVEIICPIHGRFWQIAKLHIQPAFKCGCPLCARDYTSALNRLSTEQIIERIKKNYKEKYGTSLVKYGNNVWEPIKLVCKIHGEFEIAPYFIGKRKELCEQCKHENDLQRRVKSFLDKAKEIHGNKYDYSKVEYINSSTHIQIVCPIHGAFKQRPSEHLSGKGCEKCYHESRRITTDVFLMKAKKVWGDRWDYSKSKVCGWHSNITIICKKHGEFKQVVHNHLAGNIGCGKCQRESNYFRFPRTTDEFIEKAKSVHGFRYDYSLITGVCSNISKVKIICKKHGVFEQTVHSHLSGTGCPKCRNSQQEKIISLALTRNKIDYEKEKIFKWLKRKGYLKLDFYLPEYNIAIEAQGAMHFGVYRKNRFVMTEDDLEDLFDRDRVKYKLCKEHGIRILYFCYNKEWVPDNYIDHVYTTVKELLAELGRIKPP